MDDDIERNGAQIITQDHSVQRKYLAEGVKRIEIKVNNSKTNQEFQGCGLKRTIKIKMHMINISLYRKVEFEERYSFRPDQALFQL